MDVQLTWSPHPAQQEIMASDARFKTVACGRRFGKTELAAIETSTHALENNGSDNWWVAPTYDQAEIGWDKILEFLPDALIKDHKRSKPRHFELLNGSRISFRSADHPDTLRGVGLDSLVIDEAAMISEEAWNEALRPTLTDAEAPMMAISTPKGRNWFHRLHQRGKSEDNANYEAFSFPTWSNPHISETDIEDAEESLSERVFDQEYAARFIDDSGGVFTKVEERIVEAYDWEDVDGTSPYAIGVDFARHQDWTVIIVLDTDGRLVEFKRLQDLGWPQIQARVEDVYNRYKGTVALDASRDNKIVSDLESAGVTVEPVKFTSVKKSEMVENLATAIEAEELTVPDTLPIVISELQLFEYDVLPSGNVRYEAPPGHHDDCVDALCLTLEARDTPISVGEVTLGEDQHGANDVQASEEFRDSPLGQAAYDQLSRY